MLEQWRIVVSYSDVSGQRLPLSEATARLKLFPLDPLLQLLSRADCTLAFLDVEKEDNAQAVLIQELLTPAQRTDLKTVLVRLSQEPRRQAKHLVFHELQILNAVKLALIHCEDSVAAIPPDLTALGEALLILNDHLAPVDFASEHFATLPCEKQHEIMRSHLIQSMSFHQGVRIADFLARWYDFIFLDAKLCTGRPGFRDLLSELSRITGLNGMLYYCLGHMLFAHWLGITHETAGSENPVVRIPDWFTTNFDIPPTELERTFEQFGATREAIKSQLEGRPAWEPFYFLPMQANPILRRGDLAFCLSKRFLAEKLGPGLYHTVLAGQPDRKQGDLFLTFFGYVFESYIHRLLTRIFPPASALIQRYLQDVRHPDTNEQLADGIIVYEDAVVLIEAKAPLFPVAVLASGDPAAIEEKLEAVVFHAARQLNRLIGHIRAEKLTNLGIEPTRIRRYYPLVISLQFVPLGPLLYGYIQDTIERQGCFRDPIDPTKSDSQVAPLQVASIADMERLETALATGKSLVEILARKTSSYPLSCETFGNFLLSHMPELVSVHNAYIQERFSALTSEVMTFATTRERHIVGPIGPPPNDRTQEGLTEILSRNDP
jgi:hypothetical protein